MINNNLPILSNNMIIQHQNERFIVALLDFVCLVLAVVFLRFRDKNDIVLRKVFEKKKQRRAAPKMKSSWCVCVVVSVWSVLSRPCPSTKLSFGFVILQGSVLYYKIEIGPITN